MAGKQALWAAATLGQLEEMRVLLAGGADTEERGGPEPGTPLHWAAFWGQKASTLNPNLKP